MSYMSCIAGNIPCLSQTVAHCGVHTLSWTVAHCGVYTLFVTDCCTLWGTYLVCHGLLHIAEYVCHWLLHIAGYRHIQLLSNTGNPMPNCTLFVHVAITNKRGGGVSSCFFSLLTDLRLYTSLCLEELMTGDIWLTWDCTQVCVLIS